MPLVKWTKQDTTSILTMTSKENRHNLDFANEMNQAIDDIFEDESILSLILTSDSEKNFSLGVDVEWLMQKMAENDSQSIKDFMYAMNNVFKKLIVSPFPTIAAINGHAFGNGAILACACDFRLMNSSKGYFCFPEIDLGIPFLPGMIAWVRKAIPEYKYQELLFTGKRTTAQELEEHHIISKSCPDPEILMTESIKFAQSFEKKRGIFGEMKKRLYKHIIHVMDTEDTKYIESLFLTVFD